MFQVFAVACILLLSRWEAGAFVSSPQKRVLSGILVPGSSSCPVPAVALDSSVICQSTLAAVDPSESSTDPDEVSKSTRKRGLFWALRATLRGITGFSWTAFRATLRAITGISLTAIWLSTLAATGLWIRKTMSIILSIFPAWFRYFLQPFLIIYYFPLVMIRQLTSPANRRGKDRSKRMQLYTAWEEVKSAADQAEKDGYWPVKVSDDGYWEAVAPPEPGQSRAEIIRHAGQDAIRYVEEKKRREQQEQQQQEDGTDGKA